VVYVILGAIACLTVLGWFIRRSKYDQIKRHVVLAAVADASMLNGGGVESMAVRKIAMATLARLKAEGGLGSEGDGGGKGGGKGGSGKKGKKGGSSAGRASPVPSSGGGDSETEASLADEALMAQLRAHFGKWTPPHAHMGPKETDKEVQKHCLEKWVARARAKRAQRSRVLLRRKRAASLGGCRAKRAQRRRVLLRRKRARRR
jgi:hypothetical protein